MKTTIQIFYDKGLFDNFDQTDEVIKYFLVPERRAPDLGSLDDVVQ